MNPNCKNPYVVFFFLMSNGITNFVLLEEP
jgi:hypothetical protein